MAPPPNTLLLLLASLAPLLALVAPACTLPYEAQPGPYTLRVAPGEVRDFPAGLTVAAGERVLLEGTARVTGGVTVRGQLFFSNTASSTLSAEWVVVEAGGQLWAGSEACPVPPGVTATLELRAGAVHPQAGRKALAVLSGGTLEVRGRRRC